MVLVACSDLDFLLISKILQKGYVLDYAQNRTDILKKLPGRKYDLFLVDSCFLKTGEDVIRLLQHGRFNVVALSSEPADARDRRLKGLGCKACYIKPFRLETFSYFVEFWCK